MDAFPLTPDGVWVTSEQFTKFIKTGIADKNDYPLYFEKVIYEADIDENVELNHNFLNVTAKTHGEACSTFSNQGILFPSV
uniref:Uncharacterized protein n=1 Tax=Anopheles minimus TaxID=112268 RepID=A0A182WGG0_9DIPT